jgi:SAM-dependent methyltransferase
MFSLGFLHTLRDAEMARVAQLLPAGARVLELGAGTGYQAKILAESGFRVTAIDLAGSTYAADRVYPVIDYDGRQIPLPDGSVDVVFSSNVLEHVRDLPSLMHDTARVLAPGGSAVHVLPSPAWRFWTSVAGWLDLVPLLCVQCRHLPGTLLSLSPRALLHWAVTTVHGIGARILPVRHGERGNALSELWTFSRHWWRREFDRDGFEIVAIRPMGLFYTGFMVLGPRLSLPARARLARVAGSGSTVYRLRPRTRS